MLVGGDLPVMKCNNILTEQAHSTGANIRPDVHTVCICLQARGQ